MQLRSPAFGKLKSKVELAASAGASPVEASDNAQSISIRAATKRFGDQVALDSVDLEVAPGTFLVLLGPSGSGKSTLLRTIAGIETLTKGSIHIDDKLVSADGTHIPPDKRGLSMVFQDFALWPHLTAHHNVSFALKRRKLSKEAASTRALEMLDRVGLAHFAGKYPNELSGGEQQRVALARALAAGTGLILFDEPLSSLDADRREQLRIEIASLTRECGATSVYITHDQAEAFALADRIGILKEGKLVQHGTPEEIYRCPSNEFVARFTGVAGEIPGVVTGELETRPEHGGDDWPMSSIPSVAVRLPAWAGGKAISVAAPAGIPMGRAGTIFFRPAGCMVSSPDESSHVNGIVLDVAFCGRGYELAVRMPDGSMLTKVFSENSFKRGENVGVWFERTSSFLLPATEAIGPDVILGSAFGGPFGGLAPPESGGVIAATVEELAF